MDVFVVQKAETVKVISSWRNLCCWITKTTYRNKVYVCVRERERERERERKKNLPVHCFIIFCLQRAQS